MQQNFFKDHENELIKIITDTVQETFHTYFQTDILFQNLPVPYGQQKEPVIFEAIVHSGLVDGAVVMSFEKDALINLAKMVYPPELAPQKEALEGCAEEITNIVGTRVKNYLNEYDLNLHMNVPHLLNEYDGKRNFLHVSFVLVNNSLMVDVILKKHKRYNPLIYIFKE